MSLFSVEFLRVIAKRSVFLLFVFFIFANLALSYLSEQNRFHDNLGNQMFSVDAYRGLLKDLQSMDAIDRLPFLHQRQETLRAYMFETTDMDNAPTDAPTDASADAPADAPTGEGFTLYAESFVSESFLLRAVSQEFEEANGYEGYLESVFLKADSLSNSIFAGSDAFTENNIRKTKSDYGRLSGINVTWDIRTGVQMATEFPGTDILMVLSILFICLMLVTREKECQILPLLKSTRRGRNPLLRTKYACALCFTLLLHLCMSASHLWLAAGYYGLGDVTRSLQSVYLSASLPIAVWQYILLVFLVRLLVYSLFVALILFICVISRSAVGVYIKLSGLLAVSVVLYLLIPAYSLVNILKYLNLFYFLQPSALLVNYVNINLLDTPVNLLPLALATVLFVGVVVYASSLRRFRKSQPYGGRAAFFAVFRVRCRTIRLFSHEIWKSCISCKAILLLLALLCIQVWRVLSFPPRPSAAETIYRTVVTEVQGTPTEENRVALERELEELEGKTSACSIEKRSALTRVLARVDYLFAEKPEGKLLYDTGYETLMGGNQEGQDRDRLDALLFTLFAMICVVPVWTQEADMRFLLRSTRNGRGKLFLRKVSVALLLVSVLFVLVNLAEFMQIFHVYGLRHGSAKAGSLPFLQNIGEFSLTGALILMYVTRLMSCYLLVFAFYAVTLPQHEASPRSLLRGIGGWFRKSAPRGGASNPKWINRINLSSALMKASLILLLPLVLSVASLRIWDVYPVNLLLMSSGILQFGHLPSLLAPVLLFCAFLSLTFFLFKRNEFVPLQPQHIQQERNV